MKDKRYGVDRYPIWVEKLYEQRQHDVGNRRNLTVLYVNRGATWSEGGFDWDSTPEGYRAWNRALTVDSADRDFTLLEKKDKGDLEIDLFEILEL